MISKSGNRLTPIALIAAVVFVSCSSVGRRHESGEKGEGASSPSPTRTLQRKETRAPLPRLPFQAHHARVEEIGASLVKQPHCLEKETEEDWHLKSSGADLAKAFLSTQREVLATPVELGIVDMLFSSKIGRFSSDRSLIEKQITSENIESGDGDDSSAHGTQVAEILFEATAGRKAAHLRCVGFLAFWKNPQCDGVKIANRSGGHLNVAAEKAFAARGGILVMGSGNAHGVSSQYRFANEDAWEPAREPDVLLVGSHDRNGLESHFSEHPPDLAILAPGANLMSRTGESAVPGVPLSGTSFATPLVSAALANALSLAPKLDVEATRALLSKTALPSMSSKMVPTGEQGVGTLNAYAMVRLVHALRMSGVAVTSQTIEATDLAEQRNTEVSNALNFVRRGSCADMRSAHNALRAAYFLGPEPSLAEALADVARAVGDQESPNRFALSALNPALAPAHVASLLESDALGLVHKGMQLNHLFTFAARFPSAKELAQARVDAIMLQGAEHDSRVPSLVVALRGRSIAHLFAFASSGDDRRADLGFWALEKLLFPLIQTPNGPHFLKILPKEDIIEVGKVTTKLRSLATLSSFGKARLESMCSRFEEEYSDFLKAQVGVC